MHRIIVDKSESLCQPSYFKPPAILPCKNPLTAHRPPHLFLYVLTRVSQIWVVHSRGGWCLTARGVLHFHPSSLCCPSTGGKMPFSGLKISHHTRHSDSDPTHQFANLERALINCTFLWTFQTSTEWVVSSLSESEILNPGCILAEYWLAVHRGKPGNPELVYSL